MKALVISPTYNEHGTIAEFIHTVFAAADLVELLIVDDNSPDGTAEIVQSLQEQYRGLHLIRRPGKLGLGTAYVAGFDYALENGFDAVIQMDADMSHDPRDISRFVQELECNDLVIGSRYCDGVSVVRWPLRRLMLSIGATRYVRLVTGLPTTDATTGFKGWRRETLASVLREPAASEGYSFQIEMSFRAWRLGARMREIPIIFVDRTIGQSKMSRKIVREAVWMVWRLRWSRLLGRKV